ncbi:hypothetical protein JJL45_05255 [Tamlana sp. s12]|uniref:hypothetical protein n=1 Tax=Tamlana sp. s12 TaxID=1630406 RepID=UPI0007FE6B23|nr:hypothetical protein [Tamlana sp. s12]OBQ56088.1 hypothetical protein VQ01_06805 [Tamlana sp. s12]QQY83399.1 hypothetical protein JJL45_05255 [Tamlana sp. s12]
MIQKLKALLVIPQDKANHTVYGFLIHYGVEILLVLTPILPLLARNLRLEWYHAAEIVTVIAIFTEIYDWKVKSKPTGFSCKDIAFTVAPSYLLTLLKLITILN